MTDLRQGGRLARLAAARRVQMEMGQAGQASQLAQRGSKLLSRDWTKVFSEELGGVTVRIAEGNPAGSFTSVTKQNNTDVVDISIGTGYAGEVGMLGALRHEHGHVELDSFGLDVPELKWLTIGVKNVVEDARINVMEARRYRGFRDGYKASFRGEDMDKVRKFLWNCTQNAPANADEKYIFELAVKVNNAKGGRRGEHRSKEWIALYEKFARAVVRYTGGQTTPPDFGQQGKQKQDGEQQKGKPSKKEEEQGSYPGEPSEETGDEEKKGETSEEEQDEDEQGSAGEEQDEGEEDGKGSGSQLEEKEDKPLTSSEAAMANTAALKEVKALEQMYAQHSDIGEGHGHGQGLGGLMGRPKFEPPVDPEIKTIVEERLKLLKLRGTRGYEAGVRVNMRMAARARFTGETKLFRAPAREDIKNQKFVLLQDVSSSMSSSGGMVHGIVKSRVDLAYHFARAFQEFMVKHGAKVEAYRFGSLGFIEGLSYAADDGTCWLPEDVEKLVNWVKEGRQVIILTDGQIGFGGRQAEVEELFARAERRPVGLQFGAQRGFVHSSLERICPDWKQFNVYDEVSAPLDAMVTVLSRRFKF